MLKKSIFIIVPVIIVIGLIFGYGIKTYNSKYVVFQSDGHIFAEKNNKTTEKYFFDTNSKYKIVDDNVKISMKENEVVTIPADTFIHYKDGSISTFSKSVVLDLDEVEQDKSNYTYYNVFPGTIFVKNGSKYSVNYLDKKLSFTNFLLKINNEKFMIVGNKIKLKIGDNEKEIENNYLEISYLDGNVLKIDNQGVSFQSVSDEVSIEIGNNTLIDFVQKNVYSNKEKKLSLGEITVDSDDNIPISADDNKFIDGEETDEDSSDGKSSSKSNSDSNSNSGGKKYTRDQLPNMSSGVVDTTTDSLEEIIDANARVKDAEFKVVNMDVNANRLRASVQIVDEAAVFSGDINIKIIEANTNKVVYETNDDSGSNMIDIENEALDPETNYILVLNSDYRKNDVTYNKDFVQKTFITDAIGVTLDKYYVSENQLQVNVKKSSYSDVVSVDVALEDNDEKTIKTLTVPLQLGDNILSFGELTHDTRYKVRVYNFVYQDSIVTDGFTILKAYETLKKKPTIGDITFSMDKKEGKFNMLVNNMLDPDGGITSYKYEVYDARTIDDANAKPITIVEKNTNASASLKIDGNNIKRGVPYVFRVVMNFNDNEKEYDYTTEYSDVMKVDGVAFPVVKFNKREVTFEKITGDIEIIDEGNTINLNDGSLIKVTYTSSSGESNTITSSGSLIIPITEAVGLRSNETYTFSVMATVDLQDGNPPIDSCYIGSVIVKTEDPNPFKMEFVQIDDPAYAFNVDAQLLRKDKSTELEANTLTGITFNLYQGRGTSGKLVKSIKDKDRDEGHYSSDLRKSYYDTQFRIDPSFFGLRNSDLTSEYYTIEVTGAYDYTKYPNELPIDNNTVTIKAANALPDMPADTGDSVDFVSVTNRDLPDDQKRDDLDDGTVVGYKFRAAYNNDAKYAKRIIYKIIDKDTEEVIKTVDYNVPVTGEINYSEISIGDGISSSVSDGTLRRGQSFYISYTVELDTNYDETVDVVYPLNGILTSKTISPARQEPEINMYPAKSTTSNYTWKYTYSDVDHTLVSNQVMAYVDGDLIDTKALTLTNDYKEVTFNLNKTGAFSIYGNYNLVNDKNNSKTSLSSQYYEGINTSADFGKVSVFPDKNRVIFSFLNYAEKEELFSKFSAVKIDFTADGKTITVDGLSAKTGSITVNYSLIEEFIGKTITPKITVYYDSGMYGFENTGDAFALQQIRNTKENRFYYSYEDGKMKSHDTADGSYLTYNIDFSRKKFSITPKVGGNTFESGFFVNHFGINFDSTYVSPKKLVTSNVAINGTSTFSFDTIIPGVSLEDESGSSTISAYVNSATLKMTAYGVENQLRDDKIYVEVYKTLNESGSEAELVSTYDYNVADLGNTFVLGDLLPKTDYYLMVYGNVKNASGGYTKQYLYDVNQKKDSVHYYFRTIGNVGISNIKVKYSASSYQRRYFYVTYNLAETIGYSYIKYNVYKIIDDTEEQIMENVVTQNDTLFKESMKAYIVIPNDCGVVTGEKYRIEVQPVLETTIAGEDTELELDNASATYSFKTLYKPYFIINKSVVGDSLSFRVNVKDYHKSVVDGKYKVKMLNSEGTDITPAEYKNKEYNIYTVNQLFTVGGVKSDTRYQLIISYSADIYNDKDKVFQTSYVYNTVTSTIGDISLGNVYADADMSDVTKVNLRFFDSYQLTEAKKIRYSIYDENSFSIDNEASFVPHLAESNGTTYYEYQLPTSINSDGIYYISMQFLDDSGEILAEETVEYRLL